MKLTPVRNKFLVFGKPHFDGDEIKEVIDTIKSGWWGTGPKAELFENKFKKYIGSKYALAVNSATAGLHLALKVLGVGPGDEVITTPLTFCSTVNVIIHCGAKPVFADVDIKSWNIDPNQIRKKITKRTKVILPVHLHGRPCNMDEIMRIAKNTDYILSKTLPMQLKLGISERRLGILAILLFFLFTLPKISLLVREE